MAARFMNQVLPMFCLTLSMKKIFTVVLISFCLLIFAAVLWQYRFTLIKFSKNLPTTISNAASSQQIEQIKNTASQIFTPTPLKSLENNPNSKLTAAGIIKLTNQQRKENGNLPALKENDLLNNAAQAKLKDLFAKQYFEHNSPSGSGPADLAKAAGYNYIMIGENLALGNFKDDEALVVAWMNSPGHRENILNSKYQDIGVAVGRGMYNGEKTWIAVQEFGKPVNSCPIVEANLKSEIGTLQNDINDEKSQIIALKQQMDALNPQMQAQYDAYNQMAVNYNNLIHIYNNKVDSLKLIVDQYNQEVKAYNACLEN